MKENKEAHHKEAEYLAGWKRAQADLENFRKEEARRVQEVLRFGNERLFLEMLDILDGLESALQHAPPETDRTWLQGLEQAIDRFRSMLAKHNVQKIDAVGKPFDPLYHEAMQTEANGSDTQTVLEQFRPGYTLHGKVIRPARVKVSS